MSKENTLDPAFYTVMHDLLKLLCRGNDVLDSDAVHSQKSLIRSGLAELILNTDPSHDALAFFSNDFLQVIFESL